MKSKKSSLRLTMLASGFLWRWALALPIAGLALAVAPAQADVSWHGADLEVLAGSAQAKAPGSFTLDQAGVGLIAIDTAGKQLSGDLNLLLSIRASPALHGVEVIWPDPDSGRYRLMRLPLVGPGRYRQSMASVDGWPASLPKLVFKLMGAPHTQMHVDRISLEDVSLLGDLRAMATAWRWPGGWTHASINLVEDYTGAATRWAPVPLLVLLVLLVALSALRSLGRLCTSAGLRVVGIYILVVWLLADLAWLRTLGVRAIATVSQFGGLEPAQALHASVDGPLVALAEEFSARFDSGPARVFVASADDYTGMRMAYYLYPANVYWQRSGSELPGRKHLHAGDLIAVVQPSELEYRAGSSQLSGPAYPPVKVRPLARGALGSLYQVQP